MELTLPKGGLETGREEIKRFYGELLGWEAIDVPILGQLGLLLRTDPETSQFILVTEQDAHLESPGYDHLGIIYDSREEVDAILEKTKKMQAQDERVRIKEYEDLVTGGVTTHAFYVKFLLPIWFDIQVQEFADGSAPKRSWTYG
ncbi:MAG: hypothetical protein CL931_00645 [Deltaproteobacteria bacterium]|nr:hypothetical protein [Deltaproteobacteria bacterium]